MTNLEHNLELVPLPDDGELERPGPAHLQLGHQLRDPPAEDRQHWILSQQCSCLELTLTWGCPSPPVLFCQCQSGQMWTLRTRPKHCKLQLDVTTPSRSTTTYVVITTSVTWMNAGLAARPTKRSMCIPLSSKYTPSSRTFSIVHLDTSRVVQIHRTIGDQMLDLPHLVGDALLLGVEGVQGQQPGVEVDQGAGHVHGAAGTRGYNEQCTHRKQ